MWGFDLSIAVAVNSQSTIFFPFSGAQFLKSKSSTLINTIQQEIPLVLGDLQCPSKSV